MLQQDWSMQCGNHWNSSQVEKGLHFNLIWFCLVGGWADLSRPSGWWGWCVFPSFRSRLRIPRSAQGHCVLLLLNWEGSKFLLEIPRAFTISAAVTNSLFKSCQVTFMLPAWCPGSSAVKLILAHLPISALGLPWPVHYRGTSTQNRSLATQRCFPSCIFKGCLS